MWTCIFHVHPLSIGETRFLMVKKIVLEKSESPLILFYFKKENKKRKKTLKK